MIKQLLLFFSASLLSLHFSYAQGVFQNPGFEGPSAPHVVPAPWDACFGTPDEQPGNWGITQAPSNGTSYISMLQGGTAGSYNEGASQQLVPCLTAGTEYQFDIDIAFSATYNTAEPGNCYGSLEILGGNSLCGQGEILWQSGSFMNTAWQTTTVTFTPTSNWCFITFHPYWISDCNGYVNSMIDNIQPIVPAVPPEPGINITSPTANADMPCSFTVTGTNDTVAQTIAVSGDFIGSPQMATLLTDSTWELVVTYPPAFDGSTQIIAGALFVDNTTDADTVDFNIVLPEADFTATIVCEGIPTVFTDLSTAGTGTITAWDWDFDDGNSSNVQSPTHTYLNPGTYNATLTITNDAGCEHTFAADVIVNPNPEVEFTAPAVCVGNITSFQNQTTIASGNVVQWDWDFGDGVGTDTQQNPTYQYTNVQTYPVTLSAVSDSGCTGTVTHNVDVNSRPTADFSFVSGCSPTVQFTDLSSVPIGNLNAWNWSFGDFATSTLQSPSHDYSFAGAFSVRLIAGSGLGCTDTMIQVVNVHAVPVANFSAPDVCEGAVTSFQDLTSLSSGSIISWDWDFDDGNTDTQQNPTNTYTNYGTYTVSLSVESDSGCTDTYTRDIEVFENPVAAFSGQDVCAGTPINFNNTSSITTGNIAAWHWDFGDFELIPAIPNSTSTVEEPVFTFYADGTFIVELIATSDNGCKDTVENTFEIYPVPVAGFSTANVCFSYDAVFTDESIIAGTGVITDWDWDFGNSQSSTQQNPSHNYANTGYYNVTLTVTSDNNCTSSFMDRVRVHPNPVADFVATEVCVGTTTDFNDQSVISLGDIVTWEWDFDDANTSLLQDPQNLYATSGIYDVQLIVTSDSACSDTIIKPIDVNGYPVVDFRVSPLNGCVPLTVNCVDLSTIEAGETIATYDWQFSDGGTSTDQDAVHVFGADGTFSVTLTATSADGCSTTKDSIDIITVFPKPIAAFNYGPQPTNVFDRNIVFVDLSSGATEWEWDFGDFSGTDITQSPEHMYPDSGHYPVEQIVTNQFGCKDTVVHLVIIDGAFALYVPSAFTPNSDGVNDEFTPRGFGFTNFEFRVYNRWGQQVFSTFIYGESWNGTFWNTGKELPNDLYVYNIEVTDFQNERHKYNGTVTLVK